MSAEEKKCKNLRKPVDTMLGAVAETLRRASARMANQFAVALQAVQAKESRHRRLRYVHGQCRKGESKPRWTLSLIIIFYMQIRPVAIFLKVSWFEMFKDVCRTYPSKRGPPWYMQVHQQLNKSLPLQAFGSLLHVDDHVDTVREVQQHLRIGT